MTKKPEKQKRLRKPLGGPADVGYGKPPPEHRWPPGKSGNPKGRRKGSKNESTILREIMARKLDSRGGKKVSVLEAILLRMAEDSLKGNTKTAAFLLNRNAALVTGELRPTDLNGDDQEVLAAFARRLASKGKNEGDASIGNREHLDAYQGFLIGRTARNREFGISPIQNVSPIFD